MAFTPKDWRNSPETTTPISAAALEDLETRVVAAGHTIETDEILQFEDAGGIGTPPQPIRMKKHDVNGIEIDGYFTVRADNVPGNAPEMHWQAINGAWFIGMDVANDNDGDDSKSRDFALGPIRYDGGGTPSTGDPIGVQDFLFFRNFDAPVLNIGGTPLTETEARTTIMSEFDTGTDALDPAMATLRLRAASDQTAPALAIAEGYGDFDVFAVAVDGSIEHRSASDVLIREMDGAGREDSYGGALSAVLLAHRMGGDSAPRFTLTAEGKLGWSGDGVGATDKHLWLHGTSSLRTDATLIVEGGALYFGAAVDAELTRYGPGALQTPGDFRYTTAGKGPIVKSPDGNNWRIKVSNAGALSTEAA